MRRTSILSCGILALSVGCGSPNDTDTTELTDETVPMAAPVEEPMSGPTVSVTMEPTDGNTAAGMLTLTEVDDEVEVFGQLSGLPADASLGFHVHQVADCSAPDASSAGDHFNPTNQPHGDPDADDSHLGDMPNVEADGDGMAEVDVTIDGVTLGAGPTSLNERAIVLHSQPDDFETQPSGGSGDPLACGEITLVTAGTSGMPSGPADPARQ